MTNYTSLTNTTSTLSTSFNTFINVTFTTTNLVSNWTTGITALPKVTRKWTMFYDEEVEKITRSDQKYLKSHYWRKRKALYFEKNIRQCFLCAKTKNIHLHHRTYVRLNAELDEDLVRLCGTHHQELHRVEIDHSLSVEEATMVYLAYKANCDLKKVMGEPALKKALEALSAR